MQTLTNVRFGNKMSADITNSSTSPIFDYDMDDSTDCMEMPQDSQSWSIIFEGVLSVIVGICGLMGNSATITVLKMPTFKETFHKLLICLSCFDSIFIGKQIPNVSLIAYNYRTRASSARDFYCFKPLFWTKIS